MKQENQTNHINSAVLYTKSADKECSVDDPRTNNEKLVSLSSERLTKYFERHSSLLYEDVHENASSLEEYLSADPASDVKVNEISSKEKETVVEEKCYSKESQKLYSSLKRYNLKNCQKTSDLLSVDVNDQITKKCQKELSPIESFKLPDIEDPYQLPVSNEAQNTAIFDGLLSENNLTDINASTISNETPNAVTFDAFLSENNLTDVKFPNYNSSSLSPDMTKAHKSLRLNKKIKKINKLSNENLALPCRNKDCLKPEEVISRAATEKPDLEKKENMFDKKNTSKKEDNLNENNEDKVKEIGSFQIDAKANVNNNCNTRIKAKKKAALGNALDTADIFKNASLHANAASGQCLIDSSSNAYFVLNEQKHQHLLNEQKYQHLFQEAYQSDPYVELTDILKDSPDLTKKLKYKNETVCDDEPLSKLSSKFQQREPKSKIKTSEKSCGKSSKKVLNKNFTNNKAASPVVKSNLYETNDSVGVEDNSFIPDEQNSFSNQSDLPKLTNVEEHIFSIKKKLKIRNHSCKKSVYEMSFKKTAVSRNMSVLQNTKMEAKFKKQNTSKKKTGIEKEDVLKEDNAEDMDLPVNENGSDLINDKVTADKNLNAKNKRKRNASKKKTTLQDQNVLDFPNIVKDAASYISENRSNLSKHDIVAVGNKKVEAKNRAKKKKISLQKDEDIFSNNEIVKNLPIHQLGKSFVENAIVTSNRNLKSNVKVNKKNKAMKKTELENEDIFNKNNIVENSDLSVNEFGKDLIKNKMVADVQNQKFKSIQLFETSTPVSQNSLKNIFDHTNKSTSSTSLSVTPQKDSSNFLQLYRKVIESSKSEVFSNTDNPFAKLFEQRGNSEFRTSNNISNQLKQKQGKELLPGTSKTRSINLENLKSLKTAEEKSFNAVPLRKKRSNEDDTEVTPLQKKKRNQEPIIKNKERNFNGEIKGNEVSDKHCNGETTKISKKQVTQSIVDKLSCRRSKRNKKTDEKKNSLANSCNKEKNKSPKRIENVINSSTNSTSVTQICEETNVPADIHYQEKSKSQNRIDDEINSSINSAGVTEITPRKSSRIKSAAGKFVDIQNLNEIKGKASVLTSKQSDSLYSHESFDTCPLIAEVKSLANWNEGKNINFKKKKSKRMILDSLSQDSKTLEKSERRRQPSISNSGQRNTKKNKHLQLFQGEESCLTQPEENGSLEFNSDVRNKRKRRSTSTDPNFCYEVKTPRIRKEDKQISKSKNNARFSVKRNSPQLRQHEKTEFSNEVFNIGDSAQKESANGQDFKFYNYIENHYNLNSDGVHLTSNWTPQQCKGFISSHVMCDIQSEAKVFIDSEHNPWLSVRITPSMICNNDLFQSSQLVTSNMSQATPQIQALGYPVGNISALPFTSLTPTRPFDLYFNSRAEADDMNYDRQTGSFPSSVNSCSTPIVSDQNVFAVNPQTVSSPVSTLSVPLLNAPKNNLSKIKPSALYSENVPATSLKKSCNSSNSFVNGVHPTKVSFESAVQEAEAVQTHNTPQKIESQSSCLMRSLIKHSLTPFDDNVLNERSKQRYGKVLDELTVGDFCSISELQKTLRKQLKRVSPKGFKLCDRFDYKFEHSILNQPFIEVLMDVVNFFMNKFPVKEKDGDDFNHSVLNSFYMSGKFSFSAISIFSFVAPLNIRAFTFDETTSVLTFFAIHYIYFHCTNKFLKNKHPW